MKKFKTESKKILNLMINSIYTNKEIFLRELISNASDAIDKLYFEKIKNGETGVSRNDFEIIIEADKTNRTLTISDNGIGMNKESLENNLGTIAKSGSEEFSKLVENKDDINLIGQFGVGFYSAFMVANKIEVYSKAYKEDEAYLWQSEGEDGYDITPCEKEGTGTKIVLHLKQNTENDDYDAYLQDYKIRSLVKKYSDYIRFAIKFKHTTEKGEEEYQILNSQTPIWRKNKNEITKEEYEAFYRDMFSQGDEPLDYIHINAEGKVNFKALLYIPKSIPYGYYSKEYEKGLKLYTNGVMITEKCSELLPDYLNFVKGVVDGELQLNISRETLQQSHELKLIASQIEDKIKNELYRLQRDEKEKYEEFFKAFGLQIKYSLYKEWGMNKDSLQDLLLYYSVKEEKFVTLNEYFNNMKDDQKYIYYSCGSTIEGAKSLPQVETLMDYGYDTLCMNEEIDEFTIKFLRDYKDKNFVNILSDNLGIYNDEDDNISEENKVLIENLKELLGSKVEKVKLSKNLKNHPVCLSSEGDISLEMERTLNANPNNHEKIEAKKVLEINENHPIFAKINSLYSLGNKEDLTILLDILYNQARLISGLTIDKPAEFSENICKLLS